MSLIQWLCSQTWHRIPIDFSKPDFIGRIPSQDGGSFRGVRQAGQYVEPDVSGQPSSRQRGRFLVPRPERHRRQSSPFLGLRPHRFPLRRRHGVAYQSSDHHQPATNSFGKLHLSAHGCRSSFRHRTRHQRYPNPFKTPSWHRLVPTRLGFFFLLLF